MEHTVPYMDFVVGIPTLAVAAWIIYITLHTPGRWTYQTDTSQMRDMPRVYARLAAAFFLVAAVTYWIAL